jgi:hypothetical protein
MKLLKIMAAALVCLALGGSSARALTVDQVVALRKAGVSNKLIEMMIQHENQVRAQGGVGRYVIKQSQGNDIIVYRASSPRGVVDYPVSQELPGAADRRFGVVLDASPAPARTRRAAVSRKNKPAVRGKLFTLHLASFRDSARAAKELKALKAKGVAARLVSVDLPGKGRWSRVLAGKFAEKSQAEARGFLAMKGKAKSPVIRSR